MLFRHLELLVRWNRRINLTSIRRPEDIVLRHFGESLFVATSLPVRTGHFVDIGSGAGFPGVPVAVALPGTQVTLVESVGKKAAFLKEVARGVRNVRVFSGRFEDVEDRFDWALVRAVSIDRLQEPIRRKARRLAVMTTTSRTITIPGIDWQTPKAVPWDPSRILVIGTFHVERPVTD